MKSGLFITAILLSVFAYAQVNPVPPAENKNAPEITFEQDVYDFGTIKQGEKVTHVFTFTNTGKEPLIITAAAGSCRCTVPEWPKDPIMGGEKRTIKVEFDSSGKMGVQDKTVTIQSNAKTSTKIIHMKGTVEAPNQVSDPTVK